MLVVFTRVMQKILLKLKNPRLILILGVFGFCITLLLLNFSYQRFLPYRDYLVIWNGATLVNNGLSPFKDFLMPVSPITIILVGFYQKYVGESYLIFQSFQLLVNFLNLWMITVLLIKFERSTSAIVLGMLFFSIFYLIFLNHPWYNNLAVLGFLFCTLMLTYKNRLLFLLAGTVSSALLFIKIDFAVLTLVSSAILIFRYSQDKDWEFLGQAISLYCLGFVASTFYFMQLYTSENFLAVTELGVSHGEQILMRLKRVASIQSIAHIGIGLFSLFLSAYYSKIFLIYGLIILIAFITSIMGGIFYTHFYYVFTIPAILLFCHKNTELRKYLVFIIPISIILILPMAKLLILNIEGVAMGRYTSDQYNSRNLKNDIDIIELSQCSERWLNMHGPRDLCALRSLLQNSLELLKPNDRFVLNVSELNFLNAELGAIQLNNHPIWYKNHVTVSVKLQDQIFKDIKNSSYPIALIQNVPSSLISSNARKEMIEMLEANKNYFKVPKTFKGPSCIYKGTNISECGITIFMDIGLSSRLEEIFQ